MVIKLIIPILISLVSVWEFSSCEQNLSNDSIQVLFLGDDWDQEGSLHVKLPIPFLTRENIHLFYEGDASSLNDDNLSFYDVVLVYSVHKNIKSEEERALFNFVDQGGGLMVINKASNSFPDSDTFTKLIGNRFHEIDSNESSIKISKPEHPIMLEISTKMEVIEPTYDQKEIADKTILAYQINGDSLEVPWKWVREQGNGRVFYTASGKDSHIWSDEVFQILLKNAIIWVAGDRAADLEPRSFPFEFSMEVYPSLEYDTSQEDERQPRPMQNPLPANESVERFVTRPGFSIELFASEPDIQKPIAMDWDERGRLWVLESIDYPNDLEVNPGEGNDRIKILEDTTGDGKADSFTIFAENLSIPTGITIANGGVIVVSAPYTKFLKDTTGNDMADVREILFEGWGTFDTHAGPSNLSKGFDNWIWGVVGYAGFEGTVGDKFHQFTMGFYRFRPDGSELEYIRATNNNTWGLDFSEEGIVFGSTANVNPVVYMPIAKRYYDRVNGWSSYRLESIANTSSIYPITDRDIQGDHKGNYTSAAGFSLYTARNYPEEYWNRISFVGDPTVHLLGRFAVEPEGSDYIAKNQWNMVASDDEWVAPVDVAVGPDGAVWMIDWYNYIPTHNLGPFAEGWEHGEGNAYITDLRDRERGRIYRIVYKNSPENQMKSLHNASSGQLVEALKSDNLFWRKTAQRLLVERGKWDVLEDLYELVSNQKIDELGLNGGALHALWTMEGLGVLDDSVPEAMGIVIDALSHPSPSVRRTAVSLLPASNETLEIFFEKNLLDDQNKKVRLAVLLKLSELPESQPMGEAVYLMINHKENYQDRWIPEAATIAASQHAAGFLIAATSDLNPSLENDKIPKGISDPLDIVSSHYASTGPIESITQILSKLEISATDIRKIILENLVQSWPEEVILPINEDRIILLDEIRKMAHKDQISGLDRLFDLWYESHDILHTGNNDGNAHHEQMAIEALSDGETVTIITDGDIMAYDITEIRAMAGNELTIRYVNRGESPTMTHNVVVVESEDDIVPIGQAALQTHDRDYIPVEFEDRIIAYTPLAPPGETVEVTLTVPPPGKYPYICTFGGHFMAMQGVLISVE
jgi:uncharacterized protein